MTTTRWRKSSYSNDSADCVEVSGTLDHLRDSKNPVGPVLSTPALRAFVNAVKANRFER